MIKLLSNKLNDSTRILAEKIIPEKIGNGYVRKIRIASGFTDGELILRTIKNLSKYIEHISFYLDLSASHYLTDKYTNEILDQAAIAIRDNDQFDEYSGIYLVKCGSLFHSKLISCESKTKALFSIGSLNFTNNALKNNEEIMLLSPNVDIESDEYLEIDQYFENLWNLTNARKNSKIGHAFKVGSDDLDFKNKDLRSILLYGRLFFEAKEQDPFRFSLRLPDSVKEDQSNLHPMLEAETRDSISLVALLSTPRNLGGLGIEEFKNLKLDRKTKSQWKRYSVETCYGYWCPLDHTDELEKDLNLREMRRQPYFEALLENLEDNAQDIEKVFLELIQSLKTRMHSDEWIYSDEDTALVAWRNWRQRIIQKWTKQSTVFKRLIRGVDSSSVPDVWSDPLTSKEFEESFLQSLLFYWSKNGNNKIANKIKLALELEDTNLEEMEIDDLQKRIEQLAKKGDLF